MKPNVRIYRLTRTIMRLPDRRWLAKETGRYYRSAAGAAKVLHRDAEKIVKANPELIVVSIMNWEPKNHKHGLVSWWQKL